MKSIKTSKSCESNKLEKNEFRAVIKHFYIKGNTLKQITAGLDKIHGTSAPSFQTVYNYVNEFKRGRKSSRDEPIEILQIEETSQSETCQLGRERE